VDKYYKLNDNDIKNLRIFLARVDLKGQEAISLVRVLNALSLPMTTQQLNDLSAKVKKEESKTPPQLPAEESPKN